MDQKYTYSLNDNDWIGEYQSRKDARAAAIEAAHHQTETPGVVYVGKIVPADTQTQHHGALVIRDMRDQASRAGVSNYLANLSADQLHDLDAALTQTLEAWLDRQRLRPRSYSVRAISEYPVPAPAAVAQKSEKEISDLGPPRQVA